MKPYYSKAGIEIYLGDCREVLPALPSESVQCCVTSPPYWGGVRDYGNDSQLGHERDPIGYVANLVYVFAELNRVLSSDAAFWLNLGDVFAASGKGRGGSAGARGSWDSIRERKGFRMPPDGYKQKDITLVPFMVADALRRAGWYARQTVIWSKPSGTEPSRLDRPSCSHEYVFLLAKSQDYYARDPGAAWWSKSVWEIRPDCSSAHPATMPLKLASRCISTCDPTKTVIDPFMGSGTVLRAAKDLGRKAIGIEIHEPYCEIAAKRLEQGVLQFGE